MGYTFALVGNPNCGKTTMFNEITGSTQYVGNWPGVTVEKKEGKAKKFKQDIKIIDLPGIYSLSPYTLEEVIARDYIVDQKPDVVINIVDSTNIERNLYLSTQLMELGVPVVIALNMIDVLEVKGDKINIDMLEKYLGVPIVPTSARKGLGIQELMDKALELAQAGESDDNIKISYDESIEKYITEAEKLVVKNLNSNYNSRWTAIKLLEDDQKIKEKFNMPVAMMGEVKLYREKLSKQYDNDIETTITDNRYRFISDIIGKVLKKKTRSLTPSDKIDKIVTNRILAIPIFFAIMWFVYYVSISTLGDYTIGWVEWLIGDLIGGTIDGWLTAAGASEWLHGLIIDGIIGGIGGVMVFVPQLMILFFFISLLEDSGYMARVAFIMDRIFRKFGLSGKSFIPMLIGSGCSVPGIMATRTIENDKDRKMTIMLTPFIPCGAKWPVFAMFIAAFFTDRAWVAPALYIIGIGIAILSGILLKSTILKGETAPFIMELPEYRVPKLKGVIIHMWDRGKAFMIKAGTIIFIASGVIWLFQSFDFSFAMVEAENSMLASIGRIVAPIFSPLGFGEWKAAVATITGLLAKEVVVATLGILQGIGEVAEDDPTLLENINQSFTALSAFSFMIFTLISAPCFAAIGAMKREFNSWKWTFITLGYQTGLAWILGTLVFQIGSLLGLG
jgi:ferrous iron transport protein B